VPVSQPLPDDLDMLIPLDEPGFEPIPRSQQAPIAPPHEPIGLGEGLPILPELEDLPPDPFEPPPLEMIPLAGEPAAPQAARVPEAELSALDASDLDWMDATLTELAPAEPEAPFSSPTVPLPPVPTQVLAPEVVAALPELPALPALPRSDEHVLHAAPSAPPVSEELASLLGDIDFQLDYGSPEEAKIEIEAARLLFPGHPELDVRMDRAESALQKLGHASKPSALDESDFANSFFDLTDVLGTALMDTGEGEEMHDATHMVEKIQSVEELFSAFREGVEKQVKGDDYDTHYNLGIAYKEMMLIDPAIEEFKIAMGDPERTLECCSMLSICEQARGDLDKAVEWLRQGILAPGFPPEDGIGLRYDLADIFLQQGRTAMAAEEFKLVYEMDPDYRDVAARLA
jgi:tetratricopeptide (TPR) repeat protein